MKKNRSKKGFTLMELIIVLAILGILLSIMVPTWGYFIRKSRERNANSKAKIIFNAAQTEITRIAGKERTLAEDERYIKTDFYFYSHNGNGTKWDDENVKAYEPDASDKITEEDLNRNNGNLSRAISRIAGNEGFYKIYVKNYIVEAVVYSNFENGRYKGTYPKTTDQLDDDGTLDDNVRKPSVQEVKMDVIKLD